MSLFPQQSVSRVTAARVETTFVLALRYLYLTRYSWLFGLVLVMLAPLALAAVPRLLANLFVLDVPSQVFHVSWLAMWCAAAVMETMRVTTLNAPLRFEDYRVAVDRFREAWGLHGDAEEADEWYRRQDGWLTFGLGLLAGAAVWFVIVHACISRTAADPSTTWEAYVGSPITARAVWAVAWRHALAGLATTLLIILLMNIVAISSHELWRRRLRRVTARWQQSRVRAELFRTLDFLLGPGYFHTVDDDESDQVRGHLGLAPGHVGLLLYTAAFLFWYFINYASAVGDRPMPTETSPYSALFYTLLSLLLMLYLFTGFAFFWDRYRIPVLLVGVAWMAIMYALTGTDHFYELHPIVEQGPDAATTPAQRARPARRLNTILDRWQLPRDDEGKRTLVVVDASGGGIQASAWTAQVLTGLHELYGDSFSRSIGLISSVSGGSVGTMFYLANRSELASEPSHRNVLDSAAIERVRDLSRSSALEATAWGCAYPDTMRVVFPPAVGNTIDRGWAIERLWRQRMDATPGRGGDLQLSRLHRAIAERQLPAFVFNATVVESGERMLISPVRGPEVTDDGRFTTSGIEFREAFPTADPRLSTAARLSATFPYVTPAARATSRHPVESGIALHHVVDGAYADNEGAVTSIDWINRLLTYYSQDDTVMTRPFDRVLLIRIFAFPKRARQQNATASHSGWRSALVGPLDAMMRVRSASQTERGDLEVSLLTKATIATIDASKARLETQAQQAQSVAETIHQQQQQQPELRMEPERELSPADLVRQQLDVDEQLMSVENVLETVADKQERIEALTVDSVLLDFQSPADVLIPLSWKLTASQKRNIDDAWSDLVAGNHPDRPLRKLDEYFRRRPVVVVDQRPTSSRR